MKMPIKLSYALIAKSLFIAGVLTLAESHASQALTTFVSGLDHPNALAFDSNGNLYIANGNGDQVIESTGSGNSQPFATVPSLPNGLAFDNSGNLYVTDYSTNSVSKVTSNGSSYTQFATGFDQPYAIVFDSQNNDFYVSNFGNGTISQITSTGTNTINLPPGSQVDAPSGLALDSSGNLYISDFNNGEIYELNTKTNALTTLVSSGLSNPVGLAVDGSGDLFVASNVGSGIISEASTAGGPLTTIATGIDVPEGLAIQGNNIYVSEVNNGGSTTGSVLVTPIPPPVPFDFSANFVGLSTLGSFWVISRLRSWYKSQSSKLACLRSL